MEVLFDRVGGLDVHRDQVTACVRVPRPSGRGRSSTVAEFSTTAGGLAGLSAWLAEFGVTHVSMEATGIYWRPVYFALEDSFELMLVNAAHMRNVPGRKTDIADARWIAELSEHGLLRPSFVPPPDIRRLRNLTRYRKTLINERGRVIQRLEKNMQDAGVKLSSVTSMTLSLTFRRITEAMIGGQRDPAVLAALAKGRLRPKIAEIRRGVGQPFRRSSRGGGSLRAESSRPARRGHRGGVGGDRHRDGAAPLGVGVVGHDSRGVDPDRGVSDRGVRFGHVAVPHGWTSRIVGGDLSGEQQVSGADRGGHHPCRADLVASASHRGRPRRGPYPQQPPRCPRHRRIRSRRGSKRAAVATGHAILRTMWHMLQRRETFNNLGDDYYRADTDAEARRLLKRLKILGLDVTVNPAA